MYMVEDVLLFAVYVQVQVSWSVSCVSKDLSVTNMVAVFDFRIGAGHTARSTILPHVTQYAIPALDHQKINA